MSSRFLKNVVRRTLRSYGWTLQRLRSDIDQHRDGRWHDLEVALDVVMSLHLPDVQDYLAFHDFVEKRIRGTFAQNFQDLFVLWALGEVRSGTFVEFGADDGVTGSNTLLLEREFSWTGLLLEPNRSCHGTLAKTRRCHVDHRAVFHTSGQSLRFIESTHR